ncbi:endonuclease/exonuclease/phosphatase [Flammeovirgaceae bacterium 311]|nr:endonuclease/exonuclease/phosphatase [Flammeovirgaceae bacterium 311]
MLSTFYIASGILFVFGILAWLNIQKWYVKIFDFGKFQFCILIVALIILYAIFIRDYNSTDLLVHLCLMVVLIGNFWVIFPFTPFYYKKEIPASKNTDELISLLICNVRQSNRETKRLKERIESSKPDVVLLTEVDEYWCNEVEESLAYLPHRILQPQDNTYGMAFYSKFKLENEQVNFYIEDDIPSIRCFIRINETDVINFFGLHPKPPAPWTKLLNKQAEVLLVSKLIEKLEDPTIVAGDMNDVGWSRITSIFKKVSGLADPRIGRGFFNTYNANIPFFRYPVDHLFVSDCFKVHKLNRMGHVGSDHFPMYATLSYEPKERKKVRERKESVSATVSAKKSPV